LSVVTPSAKSAALPTRIVAGDTVEVEISGLGLLRNRFVAQPG